jgi:hypothetical protein
VAVDLQPLIFYTYKKVDSIEYLSPGTDMTIVPGSVIVMAYPNKEVLNKLLTIAPGARVEKIDYHPDTKSDFTVIYLP